MSLHPQVKKLIDDMTKMREKPIHKMTIDEYRNMIKQFAGKSGKTEFVKHINNRNIDGPYGKIPIRIYTPNDLKLKPAVMYFRGSGFVSGDLDEQDPICRAIANRSQCTVIAVGYRAAPEYKYPIGLEDSYTATRWVIEQADELQIDPKRISVSGYSSGGNFAALIVLKLREQGIPIFSQILLCPGLDLSCSMPSHEKYTHGYLLDKEDIRWYFNQYIPKGVNPKDSAISPLWENNLVGLPPTLIITAEYDPLRSEAELYADKLIQAGVAVDYYCYEGHIHVMLACRSLLSFDVDPVDRVAEFLKKR